MKNLLQNSTPLLALVMICLLSMPQAQAQSDKRAVLKVDPVKFAALGTIHIGGEYALNNKLSIGTSVQIQPSLSSVDRDWLQDQIDKIEGGGDATLTAFTVEGRDLTVDLRWYPGGQSLAPKGFFLGAFGRYSDYDLSLPGTYNIEASTNQSEIVDTDLNLTVNGPSAGIELGAQFLIGNLITLELFTGVGVMFGKADGKLTLGETSQIPDSERAIAASELAEELNTEIQDEGLGDYLDITFRTQGENVFAYGDFLAPAFRAGITIGIAL